MKPISTKELELYKKNAPEDQDIGPLIPLSEHLNELRTKIIFSIAAICITTLFAFTFSKEAINLLTNIAPEGTNFLQIKPGEFFFTCLRFALYLGMVLASPIIIWQLTSFILPGLTRQEKNVAIPILSFAPVLFLVGSLFAYFFVAPSMLNFLFGFGKDVVPGSISIESFVSFSLMIMAICGFAFLLPIVIFALANAGIVDSKLLFNKWRHATLISIILGAVLTPTPDPVNMTLVGGILISLYFISLGALKLIKK